MTEPSNKRWSSGEVAVREPTCIGDGVTEVGGHSLSSLPSPLPALREVGYPFTAGWFEEIFEKTCAQVISPSDDLTVVKDEPSWFTKRANRVNWCKKISYLMGHPIGGRVSVQGRMFTRNWVRDDSIITVWSMHQGVASSGENQARGIVTMWLECSSLIGRVVRVLVTDWPSG